MAGARRASTMLATEPAIADGPDDGAGLAPGPGRRLRRRQLQLRRAGAAVRDIDLHLAPGTHLGVVGRTGSGKTTLGRLLARFRDADAGRSGSAGRTSATCQLAALRRRVAVVTQDVELFRASVRDNLTLFGTREASDAELVGLLERMSLGPWFAACPTGSTPSSAARRACPPGEGQLLAFARALLADPGRGGAGRGVQPAGPAHRGAHRRGHPGAAGGPHRAGHRPPARHPGPGGRDRGGGRRAHRRARPRDELARRRNGRYARLVRAARAGGRAPRRRRRARGDDGGPRRGATPCPASPGPAAQRAGRLPHQLARLDHGVLRPAAGQRAHRQGRPRPHRRPGPPPPWGLLAVLVGLEAVRWVLLVVAVQWHGCWVGWHTVPRVNLLRSLVSDPGPAAGRLPGAPGEAVSRFRDDVQDVSMVLDVWLDLSGSMLASAVALTVLLAIDPRVAVAVRDPPLVAMAGCTWLGPRLRVWRREAREATAGSPGSSATCSARCWPCRPAGPSGRSAGASARSTRPGPGSACGPGRLRGRAVARLRHRRGGRGRGAGGGGLVLRRGDLSVGDLGLFAAYASLIADLPKWVGRYLVIVRQADVSVDRLAALLPEPDRRGGHRPHPHLPAPRPARAGRPAPGRVRRRGGWGSCGSRA